MNAKFRNALFLLALPIAFHCHAGSPQPSIWEGSPTGKCFSKLEDYLSDTFVDYKNDENILVRRASEHKGIKYYWVTDATPTVNTTSTLFSVDASGRACAILFVPLSSSVYFHFSSDGSLPKVAHSINTASPGYPSRRVTYKLDQKSGLYSPGKCELIRGNKIKVINCRDARTY